MVINHLRVPGMILQVSNLVVASMQTPAPLRLQLGPAQQETIKVQMSFKGETTSYTLLRHV